VFGSISPLPLLCDCVITYPSIISQSIVMANLSEDIQCAGSDTRPHMLDRTDFASWQQCIRMYCRGKENEVNIFKSIDEGPFQMGTVREPLAEGTEGAPHLDPLALMSNVSYQHHYSQSSSTPPSTYVPSHLADNAHLKSGLSPTDNLIENLTNTLALLIKSYKTFLPQANNQLRTSSNRRNQATVQDDRVVVQNVQGQARQVKCYNCNGIGHIARNFTQAKRPQMSDYYKDKMLLMQAQENGVALDEEQLLFLQDILSKVHDHDHYQDAVCEYHEEHAMHDNVQLNHVVDLDADYTSDSNMIPYDQSVKDNAVPVVQSNVSSIPNDAYIIIYNDMYEPHAQSVSKTSRNTVVENLLTTELTTYKEQVELYER
nr:retrovirus-related Pol polyprotein from transposon TNT 1-94 [Tanacetum cinerariifolium]